MGLAFASDPTQGPSRPSDDSTGVGIPSCFPAILSEPRTRPLWAPLSSCRFQSLEGLKARTSHRARLRTFVRDLVRDSLCQLFSDSVLTYAGGSCPNRPPRIGRLMGRSIYRKLQSILPRSPELRGPLSAAAPRCRRAHRPSSAQSKAMTAGIP